MRAIGIIMLPDHNVIYLDYAASAPIRREVMAVMQELGDRPMNASSIHQWGRYWKSRLEDTRQTCKLLLGKEGEGLVFTSGGTESNALAMHQAYAQNFDQLIFSHANHDSLKPRKTNHSKPFHQVISLGKSGLIDLEHLDRLLSEKPKSFIALSLVNHETGVIQPYDEIAKLAEAYGAWLHWDAVQALIAPAIRLEDCDGDSFAISAHKCGGPHGVGALIHNPIRQIVSLYTGGGQERGARAGTENLVGIIGFAEALKANANKTFVCLSSLEDRLSTLGITILGLSARRSGHIVCIAQELWTSQAQLIHCDMASICVSMGSACSSGKVKQSLVATAMGLTHLSDKVLRISIGHETTSAEIERFFDIWSSGFAQCQLRLDNALKREAS
jgi:cysteine desulfurase